MPVSDRKVTEAGWPPMDAITPYAWTETFDRLFSLSAEENGELRRLSEPTREIEARRKLIAEGGPCRGLFILKTGWLVESKQLRDGKRQVLNFRLPGDLVGIECLAYECCLHTTSTLTRCTVSPIDVGGFEDVQRRFPRVASAFFLLTLREGAILHQWEASLGRRPALPRVGHLLLELNRRLRARGLADEHTVRLPLTQEVIADCTGLTTPYVNRVLQKMRGLGLIRLEQRTLTILDRDGLAERAEFDSEYIDGWGSGQADLTSG
jgi:CRP-like cAMP-binding protein